LLDTRGQKPVKPEVMPFPWPSAIGALLIVGWQFLLLHPRLAGGSGWMPRLLREDYLLLALFCLLLVVIYDLRRFFRANSRHREQLRKYRAQIDELFEARRELGTRARTFSDHADKLKMFISERLLEYIEYDEKFLHFKNIASEVRHNGVISYDRTQTALRHARQQCSPEEDEIYQQAEDALLYLWDLLDLSTTDNIALHVANHIYDCEEHYFQAQLNPDEAALLPLQPTFRMSHALRRALLPIVEDPAALGLCQDWAVNGSYRDEQFAVLMQGDCEMLGNVNHMMLLIENLLNNALFYARQKASRQAHNPVAIQLGEAAGKVSLRVYNRGPQIDDDEKERIYQLGFSSRRVREHHGKGLGLYFVNEITRGFEGSIGFNNIDNREDRVSLSIKLGNGELLRQQIGVVNVAGKPMCQLLESNAQVAKRHEWSYPAPITSIEISSQSAGKPQLIATLALGEERRYIDAGDPLRAYWMLDVKNRKRSATLRFVPLDVRGVEFELGFATARSRLDQQE
jgi:signal transduction histidine kinase